MLKVYRECCNNCLLSPDRIVSPERAKEIIESCKRDYTHFICHKASMNGENIVCRRFYDEFGDYSQAVQIAQRLGLVEFVDQPAGAKLPTHKKMTNGK